MKRGKAFEIIVKNFLIGIGFSEVRSDKLYIYDGSAGQMIQGLGNAHNADVLLEPMVQTPFYTPTRLLIECKDYDKKKVNLGVLRGVLGLREDINHFEIVDINILQERRKQNRKVINNYSYTRYTYQLAVASTSGFTACAQEFAATHRISLIEFDKLPFWNGLMEILGEDKENVAIEEDELKKIVKQISSHMAVAITNIGQLLFLCCQNGNEEVDFETNEYDISFKNKNEPWTLKCGNKEYLFQLPEHIAESWIEYSEYEIKRKKEVIESTEKSVSNMIVYYRCNEKPVIKMLSIDEKKLQEARKKLDETAKKSES